MREIILPLYCEMSFPFKCQGVKWEVRFCPSVLALSLKKKSISSFWDYTATCVLRRLLSKGASQRRKKNPKTQNYLLRQIQSRKGNIWLARRRTVGSVGAIHGWSRGGQPALCLWTEWCTPWGHCRRPNITDTSTHIFSLSHTHACTHTHARTCMHTHTKTITFHCFYECFINHVNGSQSYTP